MQHSFTKTTTCLLALLASIMAFDSLKAQTFPMSGFTLPAGKTICITYEVDVNACSGAAAPTQISNQASVSGTNFMTVVTDDPDIGGASDPTVTSYGALTIGNLVFDDLNRNGVFDGGDMGINGVVLNLYLDDGDGVLDAGDGMPIAMTTTMGGGLYSFSVCPGNYIVEIALSNFSGMGVLANGGAPYVSSPLTGAPDPDNDTDNDDNGDAVSGFGIASQAITIATGMEPITDGDADANTNLTLDFGLKTPAEISIDDVMLAEGSPSGTTTFTFTVSRPMNQSEDAVTLTVNTMDMGATAPGDYTAISGGSVMLAATVSSATIDVTVNKDVTVEPDEMFKVVLSGAPAHATLTEDTGEGTILNDDTDVTVAVAPSAVDEDDASNIVFTFTRTGVTSGMLTVNFSVGGTADFSTDYSQMGADSYSATMGQVIFMAMSSMATVTIDPTADTDVENDETVILTVTTGTGYNVAMPSMATGTITNDELDFGDAPDPTYPTLLANNGARHMAYPGIRLGATIDAEANGQPNATATGDAGDEDGVTLPASLITNTNASITVNASVAGFLNAWVDFDGNGSFADVGEQVFTNTPLVMGNNMLSIAVPMGAMVGNSFARFRFTSASGAISYDGLATDGEVEDYQVSILSNQYSISSPMVMEGNMATTDLTFTISRSDNTNMGSVNYAVTGGTATSGSDYAMLASGTIMFGAGGNLSEDVVVTVNGDLVVEDDETIEITLSMPVGGGIGTSPGTGTIKNDDSATLTLSGGTAQNEGNMGMTTYTFTAKLSADVQDGFDVAFTTNDGTATDADDYTDNDGLLSFMGMAGEMMMISVDVSGDTKVEDDETFTVALGAISMTSMVQAAAITIADSPQTGTINNDDTATLTLSGGTAQNEGNMGMTAYIFTAKLNNDVQGGFVVAYTTDDGSATTADNDYVDNDNSFTFMGTANEMMMITVNVNGDLKVEPNEDFTVSLGAISMTSMVQAAAISKSGSPQTGTINNDDAATVTLTGPMPTAEGNSGTTAFAFKATLGNPVQGGFDIAYTTNDGTATVADNDYADNDGSLTFTGTANEMKMITVNVNGDLKVEDDEDFMVALGAFSNTTLGSSLSVADSPQTGTIENDEVDFGDAPASYGDASHNAVPGVRLGATIDGDLMTQDDGTATGDDTDAEGDDEDGVTLPSAFIINSMANITVNASIACKLDAWVDFNADGDFDEMDEQVFISETLMPGDNALSFAVPAGATVGTSFARFRFSTSGMLSYDGLASDGEVEDYQVTITDIMASIDDPCSCKNNATTLTNGQFDETILINAPTGQTWTLIANTGLYSPASPAPPAAPVLLPTGTTTFTEDPMSPGDYYLSGVHIDAIGYSITAQNNLGQMLSISNTCEYPNPVITSDFSGYICIGSPPIPLTGMHDDPNFNSEGFTINGNPAMTFNPKTLGAGTHTVTYTVDGGTPTGTNPGPPEKGCIQSVNQTVNVFGTVACNDQILVPADLTPSTCSVTITADMLLEGALCSGVNYNIIVKRGVTTLYNGAAPAVINNVQAYFGVTVIASIIDPMTGNSCWTEVRFEDKAPPVCVGTTLNRVCTDVLPGTVSTADIALQVSATDNCSVPSIHLQNETVVDNICQAGTAPSSAVITRTWVAVDAWGNVSSPCTSSITITRPAVVFPSDIVWSCKQYKQRPSITDAKNPVPSDSNLPSPGTSAIDVDPALDVTTNPGNTYFSGFPTGITGLFCKREASFSDLKLNSCDNSGNTFKIVRSWTVTDWCSLSVTHHEQVIKVVDYDGPEINASGYTKAANVSGVHPDPCRWTGTLNQASVSDCTNFSVRYFTSIGEAVNRVVPAPGLPIGSNVITITATDVCGNASTKTVQVTVVDETAPVAICDEITSVNLTTDGTAIVNAATFDDGSWDNCCFDRFLVNRMDDTNNNDGGPSGHADFTDTVRFSCLDVGKTLIVVFRAFDCSNIYNECMVQVNVSDKIAPTCSAPGPKDMKCDDYAANYEAELALLATDEAKSKLFDAAFGAPAKADNCFATFTYGFALNLDQCLEGTITRTWQAVDASGNTSGVCSQTITVYHFSDWVVEFPKDISVNCTPATGSTAPVPVAAGGAGYPKVVFETCELVGVSHVDQVFNVVPDACYKIARRWAVINWCVVGDNIDQEKVENSERDFYNLIAGAPGPDAQGTVYYPFCDFDGDLDCDERTFRDSWNTMGITGPIGTHPGSVPANLSGLPDMNVPGAGAGGMIYGKSDGAPDTDPDSDPWDGYITWEQTIKVNDTVKPVFTNGCAIPEVCITTNGCTATFTLPMPDVTDCSPNVTKTATGSLGNGFGPFTAGPGTYSVTYRAIDNCNNQTICESSVTVKDCKKPTPYCKTGIVVTLMNTEPPMVQVWASDLNDGSFDNCPGNLRFSFTSNVNDQSITFNCGDANQTRLVSVWVTDASGLQDVCNNVLISIQANTGQCDAPLVNLNGVVATETGDPVQNVGVQLSGDASLTAMTSADGNYSFGNMPMGGNYSIIPGKDDDPLNGVTTFDLVLISKHILGDVPLGSPYKIIAADANRSNSVTTFDLVELRRLILFIYPELPSNTSWRFVSESFVFPNPANPFQTAFPETTGIHQLTASQPRVDFVAVKVGDVNGSAATNLLAGIGDRQFDGVLSLSTGEVGLKEGQSYTLHFKGEGFGQIAGMQFTLGFDPEVLEFEGVGEGLLQSGNFGTALLGKGALTASWHRTPEMLAGESGEIFSLRFKAKKPGRLSDVVSIGSEYTRAEAYTEGGGFLGVSLDFDKGQTFALYQNVPNPFSRSTVIGFDLPKAGKATLTFSDIAGKIIKVIPGEYGQGYNEVVVKSEELGASGVLYYQLETEFGTATRKMILQD